jgi:hypothetical protein
MSCILDNIIGFVDYILVCFFLEFEDKICDLILFILCGACGLPNKLFVISNSIGKLIDDVRKLFLSHLCGGSRKNIKQKSFEND